MTRRGFGSIRKLPSGRFQARFTGPDGLEHKAGTTFQTRMDADRWLARRMVEIENERWTPPAPVVQMPTLREWSRRVLARRSLTDTTRVAYEKSLRVHILPAFGSKRLDAITVAEVSDWRARIDKPTAGANAYGVLSMLLNEAVRDELIPRSPARVRGGAVKTRAKEPESLSADELATYLRAAEPRWRPLLAVTALCALRSGEVRGLLGKDVGDGVLHVRRQAQRVEGEWVLLDHLKTAAGRRDVAIPASVLPLLPAVGPDEQLFPGPAGGVMPEATLRDAHKRAAAAIGRPGLTVHGLRHTGLTLAAQGGATVGELMARAGHTTPTMALRYQRATAERDKAIADALNVMVDMPTNCG